MSVQPIHTLQFLKTSQVRPGSSRSQERPDEISFQEVLQQRSLKMPAEAFEQRPPLSRQQLVEIIHIVQAQMNIALLRAVSAEIGDETDIRLPFLSDRFIPLNRASFAQYPEKQLQSGLRTDREPSVADAPDPFIPPDRDPLKAPTGRHNPDAQGRYKDLDPIIHEAAAAYGVDPDLIKSVIKVESNFNPRSTSPKGAMGLMQLMPGTAREMGVQNAYDPPENIRAGTRYLGMLLNRYEGNVTMALAAYNWGMGNLERRPAQMPLETKSYIKNVTRRYEQIKA